MRDKLERHQLRSQQLLEERDGLAARPQRLEMEVATRELREVPAAETAAVDLDALNAAVAVQTARRERAESGAAAALGEAGRIAAEHARLHQHAEALGRELAAAEVQLRESSSICTGSARAQHGRWRAA